MGPEQIEQAIARWGTPYKAAEKLGIPEECALAVWRRMLAAQSEDSDPPIGRPPAACGTKAAYQRHVRRRESVDSACMSWHLEVLGRQLERAAGVR